MHVEFDANFLAAMPIVFMFALTFFLAFALYRTKREPAPVANASTKKR